MWDKPFLYKRCVNQMIRKYVLEIKVDAILEQCHSSAHMGHFGGDRIVAKILQFGFYWLTLFKYAYEFATNCDWCQCMGNVSKQHEMPLSNILEVKLFDV